MKIALLSGANPKTCVEGPTVRLLKGSWAIRVQGIFDSELSLHFDGRESTWVEGICVAVDKVELIKLSFKKRGSEQFIIAFAERI